MDREAVSRHYAAGDRVQGVVAALAAAGKADGVLTPEALAPLDQFHLGGAPATHALADLAAIRADMRVLDVGGGIGGPARTLAQRCGCTVTVLDLTEEYCRIGTLLTERTGLTGRVTFQQGDALDLPFADGQFDLVWTQHATMNIAEKARLVAEWHRVLRPGGRLALYEVMAGAVQPPHFPVPWARDPAMSFLRTPEEMHAFITDAGFRYVAWNDVTPNAAAINQTRAASSPTPPVLGIHLLLGPDFARLAENFGRNAVEGRVRIIQAIFDRE